MAVALINASVDGLKNVGFLWREVVNVCGYLWVNYVAFDDVIEDRIERANATKQNLLQCAQF